MFVRELRPLKRRLKEEEIMMRFISLLCDMPILPIFHMTYTYISLHLVASYPNLGAKKSSIQFHHFYHFLFTLSTAKKLLKCQCSARYLVKCNSCAADVCDFTSFQARLPGNSPGGLQPEGIVQPQAGSVSWVPHPCCVELSWKKTPGVLLLVLAHYHLDFLSSWQDRTENAMGVLDGTKNWMAWNRSGSRDVGTSFTLSSPITGNTRPGQTGSLLVARWPYGREKSKHLA